MMLSSLSEDKLKDLRGQCEAKEYHLRLEALKSFIGELEYVPKTRKDRSNMVRKGPLRPVRPARYQIRA
jgi:hypothetical protein